MKSKGRLATCPTSRKFHFYRDAPTGSIFVARRAVVDGPIECGMAWDQRVAELKTAQKGGRIGTAFSPNFLMTVVMTLTTGWTAANPFGASLDPGGAKRPATLRQNLADAVKLISSAKTGANG